MVRISGRSRLERDRLKLTRPIRATPSGSLARRGQRAPKHGFRPRLPFIRDGRFRRGRKYDSRYGLDWRPARMAAPYSLDLRERVVAAVAAGMSRKRAAAHYQVSHSSAIRWTRRPAATGTPAALPMGGKKPFTLTDEEA